MSDVVSEAVGHGGGVVQWCHGEVIQSSSDNGLMRWIELGMKFFGSRGGLSCIVV